MDDNFIDEAIASDGVQSHPNADNVEIENQAAETDVTDTTDVSKEEDQQENADSPETPEVPKKVVNALNRKDRKINALHAQKRQLEQELLQYQNRLRQFESNKPAEPQPDQFDSYEDYMRAIGRHDNQQLLQQHSLAQQQELLQQKQRQIQQEWAQERATEIDNQAGEIAKQFPEMTQLLEQNMAVVAQLPPHVQQAFLESDPKETCFAFLALAQEGRIGDLAYLSPARAAVEIGRAADRGAAIVKSRTISKAPTPMSQNKGRGGISKTPDQMSADEIVEKWLEI